MAVGHKLGVDVLLLPSLGDCCLKVLPIEFMSILSDFVISDLTELLFTSENWK